MHPALIKLHAAVLLFGFTAILGDLISLQPLSLVFWRLLIASIGLLFLLPWIGKMPAVSVKVYLAWGMIGVIMAIHWVAFFGSVKRANASVALICLATTSFFTVFLEPMILKTKIQRWQILPSLLVIPSMIMVTDGIGPMMISGVWLGLLSSLLFAVIGVLNKKWIWDGPPVMISLVELGSGCVFLGVILLLLPGARTSLIPSTTDWVYLFLLALGCTVVGHILALLALRHLSAFTSMMALNLEPIYGIILAHLILHEGNELDTTFYIGVVLILSAIFIPPIFRLQRNME